MRPEVNLLLRRISHELGMPLSEMLRCGVEHALVVQIEKAAEYAKDESKPTSGRIAMLRFLRMWMMANL